MEKRFWLYLYIVTNNKTQQTLTTVTTNSRFTNHNNTFKTSISVVLYFSLLVDWFSNCTEGWPRCHPFLFCPFFGELFPPFWSRKKIRHLNLSGPHFHFFMRSTMEFIECMHPYFEKHETHHLQAFRLSFWKVKPIIGYSPFKDNDA